MIKHTKRTECVEGDEKHSLVYEILRRRTHAGAPKNLSSDIFYERASKNCILHYILCGMQFNFLYKTQ
mgnify:CR=1